MKGGSTRWFGLIGVLILVTAGYAQGPSRPDTAAPPATVQLIVRDLAEAISVIEKNYGGYKQPAEKALIKSSLAGMLNTLDPHSHFMDADEAKESQNEMSSELFGIGATIGSLDDDKGKVVGTYVRSTSEKSPANLAGLRYGDKIIEVEGISMFVTSSKLILPAPIVRVVLNGPLAFVSCGLLFVDKFCMTTFKGEPVAGIFILDDPHTLID